MGHLSNGTTSNNSTDMEDKQSCTGKLYPTGFLAELLPILKTSWILVSNYQKKKIIHDKETTHW